jgi:hypothetical protein
LAALVTENSTSYSAIQGCPMARGGLAPQLGQIFECCVSGAVSNPSLAILALVGEIDPLGTRKDGLDAFLDQKVEEGYVIETRSDTHAIIFRRPKGLRRFTRSPDPGRYVVQVDEAGIATMRPAEPRRS